TGADTGMDENVNSRIGFKGVEDLGDGLKATFQLEKRFNVNDGTNNSSGEKDWEGAANVGLKHADWGAVRLGRMNGIATENIRKFDPFYQYGVGGMWDSTQRGVRRDNMLRYDSPEWAGFSFSAAYELGKNMNEKTREPDAKEAGLTENGHSLGYDNDGYQLGINYKNGGWAATANYQMLADTNRSSLWNVGLSYSWDTVKVEALYQQTKDKGIKATNINKVADWYGSSLTEQQALLGVEWKVGPGRLNASAQWMSVEGNGDGSYSDLDDDAWKVAVGYTYNLSKRTSLYGIVSYADYDDEQIAKIFDGVAQDSMTGVQVGITHKF
ncbi:MAG: porin, partial [Oxalobacter sp.]